MRIIIFILFLFITTCVPAQQKNTSISMNADTNKKLFNEYWSTSSGPWFENYFFYETGEFVYVHGYSGGIFTAFNRTGTYTYDPINKWIKLHTVRESQPQIELGVLKKKIFKATLSILELNDTTAIVADSTNLLTMRRVVGITTDQYWYEGPTSSVNSIHFTQFGQVTIKQEYPNPKEYVCDYHLWNNKLLLVIKSISRIEQSKKITELLKIPIRTFLKFRHYKDDSVEVEHFDLAGPLVKIRNWEFTNGEFIISSISTAEIFSTFDLYHRVKEARGQH